jgi:hypothetical protein
MDQLTNLTAVPVNLRHEFEVDYLSKVDEKRYRGKFTAKKLSIMDLSRVQVRQLQLNGGYHYDPKKPGTGIPEAMANFSNVIAHLEVSLIQSPSWWDLETITDADLVSHVFEIVSEFEYGFDSPLRGASVGNGSSSEDSGQESKGTGAAGHVEKVGRGEVPPSMDP